MHSEPIETLTDIRHAYTQKIIKYCAAIFLPVLIYASVMAVRRDIAYIVPIYAALYAIVLLLALDKKYISTPVKAGLITALPFIVCSYEFFLFGLAGSATIYLPLLVFISIATLNQRAALLSLAASIVVMGIAGYFILTIPGFLPTDRLQTSLSPASWIIRGVELIAFCGVMATGMQYIFKRMTASLDTAQRLSISLAEKQEHLEKIMGSVPGAVLMVDLDHVGQIRWSNAAATTMFDCAEHTLHAQSLTALLKDKSEYTTLKNALLSKQGFSGDELLFTACYKGRSFWGQVSGSMLNTEDAPSALLIILDVDERTRAKQAINQAQKMESLGLMASGIAHDFRNILTTVKAHTDIAIRGLEDGAKSHQQLIKAQNAIDAATSLTSSLLTYASKEAPSIAELDINNLVGDIEELISISIPRQIEVKRQLCHEAPAILGDKNQMQQVVLNLMINAAEAIGNRPGYITLVTDEIELQTWQAQQWQIGNDELQGGAYLLLEISDSGSGMDTATLQSIFDPFFTTKESGTGLGLATVFGIIRAHSGGLQVVSHPGNGTTFRLIFPVVNTPVLHNLTEIIADV